MEHTSQWYLVPPSLPREAAAFLITPIFDSTSSSSSPLGDPGDAGGVLTGHLEDRGFSWLLPLVTLVRSLSLVRGSLWFSC